MGYTWAVMAPGDRAVLIAEALFAFAILLGLVARRRYRACFAFTAYIASVLVLELLVAGWPARFFTWRFWVAKEAIQAVLKLAIVLEIAGRVFWPFPGARGLAGAMMVLLIVATATGLWAGEAGDAEAVARVLVPRILYGTACAFAVLLVLVLWFHIPLDPLHKAILLGFVPYLLVFTVAIQLLETFGWDVRRQASYVNNVGFFTLLGYWSTVVWARRNVPRVAPEVLALLQPWVMPARRRP
jgi:hypothetical protein